MTVLDKIRAAIDSGDFVKITDARGRSHIGEVAYADDAEETIAVYTGRRGRPPRYAVADVVNVEIIEGQS